MPGSIQSKSVGKTAASTLIRQASENRNFGLRHHKSANKLELKNADHVNPGCHSAVPRALSLSIGPITEKQMMDSGMLGKSVQYIARQIRPRVKSFRGTLEVVGLTFKLAEGHRLFVFGYVVLALINAATESFSIMLIVPLLQSFSSDSIFAGVPMLDAVGQLLQPFSPAVRLRWVACILLGIILVKSAVQYLTEVMIYVLPLRLERDLRMRAFSAMMESKISFAEGISSGDTGNFTASFPARAGLALRFLIQGIASVLTIIIMLALFIAITPSALVGLAGFVILGSLLYKRLTGPWLTVSTWR